jgi:hypothetical protein
LHFRWWRTVEVRREEALMPDQMRNQNREREQNVPADTDETRGIYDEGGGRVEVFEHDEEDPNTAMSHEIGSELADEDEDRMSER